MKHGRWILWGAFGGCAGCSPSLPSALDAGTDSPANEAWPDVVAVPESGPNCKPLPEPPDLPMGWELDTSYSACCGFYKPKTQSAFPPPIQWGTCDGNARPIGMDCRQMVSSWPPDSFGTSFGNASGSVRNGEAWLFIQRATAKGTYNVIAPADGAAAYALLVTRWQLCNVFAPSLNGPLFAVYVKDYLGLDQGGGLAGDVDGSRRMMHRSGDTASGSAYVPAALGVAQLGVKDIRLIDWSGVDDGPITTRVAENGRDMVVTTWASDTLFWNASNGYDSKIRFWTKGGTAKDFIAYGPSIDHGAGDLGTDGVDMVWVEGITVNRTMLAPYDTADYYTSPFTADPAKLKPRRLRSDSYRVLAYAPVVGCGYAARKEGTSLRIVRIADGSSWLLPSNAPWWWGDALAITCNEVFAFVSVGTSYNVARVKLSSLGPGLPSD